MRRSRRLSALPGVVLLAISSMGAWIACGPSRGSNPDTVPAVSATASAVPDPALTEAQCFGAKRRWASRGLPEAIAPAAHAVSASQFRVEWRWKDHAEGERCYVVDTVYLKSARRSYLPPNSTRFLDPHVYDGAVHVSVRIFPVWDMRRGQARTASLDVRLPEGQVDFRCLNTGPESLAPPRNPHVDYGPFSWSAPDVGDEPFDCFVVESHAGSLAPLGHYSVALLPQGARKLDRPGVPIPNCTGIAVTYSVRVATIDGRRSPAVTASTPPMPCAD